MGILCIRCNSFLGALETSNILPRAQRYLQDPPILKR